MRRGGEEFVLIMPATDEIQARVVAERVRTRLGERPLYVRTDLRIEQTVSIGVATLGRPRKPGVARRTRGSGDVRSQTPRP